MGTVFLGSAKAYFLAGVCSGETGPLSKPMIRRSTHHPSSIWSFWNSDCFAFRERFNPAAHKRLILIATITLMEAAMNQIRTPAGAVNYRIRSGFA